MNVEIPVLLIWRWGKGISAHHTKDGMLLAFFFFIIVLGFVLFIVAILFYKKRTGKREVIHEEAAPVQMYREERFRRESEFEESPREGRSISIRNDADHYIPVLKRKKGIPGVKEFELIHFFGRGVLFSLESLQNPAKIMVNEKDLVPEIEGYVVLTSHKLVIYNGKPSRKIVYDAIGSFQFQDPFLIIMRKDVKKKKEVVRLLEKGPQFNYIFSVLVGAAASGGSVR
jgi:hypothetical protein